MSRSLNPSAAAVHGAGLALCVLAWGCSWVAGLGDHMLDVDAGFDGGTADSGTDEPADATAEDASLAPDGTDEGGPEDVAAESSDAEGGDASDADAGLDASEDTDGEVLECTDAAVDTGCLGTLANCTGTGCDVDLSKHADHCGACGRDCLGGTCLDGECEPWQVVDGTQPEVLAVHGSEVFWGDNATATVWRAQVAGGSPTAVAEDEGEFYEIVADDAALFWTRFGTQGDWAIRGCAYVGGTPFTVAVPAQLPGGLAVDATHVYWADANDDGPGIGSIKRQAKVGPVDPTTIASGLADLAGIAVAGGHVYFTSEFGGAGVIMRVPVDGVNVGAEVLASGLNDPHGIALYGTDLYFTTDQGGEIYSLAAGESTPLLMASGLYRPLGILADSRYIVYRGYDGDVGRISRCPGGEPYGLLHAGAHSIAHDGDSYYLGLGSDGGVWRVAK